MILGKHIGSIRIIWTVFGIYDIPTQLWVSRDLDKQGLLILGSLSWMFILRQRVRSHQFELVSLKTVVTHHKSARPNCIRSNVHDHDWDVLHENVHCQPL